MLVVEYQHKFLLALSNSEKLVFNARLLKNSSAEATLGGASLRYKRWGYDDEDNQFEQYDVEKVKEFGNEEIGELIKIEGPVWQDYDLGVTI